MSALQRKIKHNARSGLSAVEVAVVLVILAVFAMLIVMALPRSRETARKASCQRNLMQIGNALSLYDQSLGVLPFVAELRGAEASGPLKSLLVELGLPDLSAVKDSNRLPPRQPKLTQEPRRVPGFVCPSDPRATAGLFPAPVSYRAATGDTPDGRNGAFAPGRRIGITQIEATDGSSYTAGFSERLVGSGQAEQPTFFNYSIAPGALPATGCPRATISAWRGDAGSSWVAADWTSTLYNHALTPNARSSCIADDQRQAFMGALSGHIEGVNLLLLDGGVRTVTPRVDPRIWRAWAAFAEAP